MLNLSAHLLWQFTQRDLMVKYQGTMLGLTWLLITPLLMLTLFTLVFHGIFGMKWPQAQSQSAIEFALFLFAGLSLFQFFSDVINRAAGLIVSQPNLVTKVVFPLWILPLAVTLASAVPWIISMLLLLFTVGFMQGLVWTWLWLPLLILPVLLSVLGAAWLIAALGVYLRDLSQLLAMLTTALMFLSPIFYPLSAVPQAWQSWFSLNPLALIIEVFRDLLVLQQAPSWQSLGLIYLLAAISMTLGWLSFRKLQRGFADVL